MAVIKKEAYFNSSNGVNKVHTLIWENDEIPPVGVVQLAHGMAEHIERYDRFARFLAENGFVVCGNDHIGHGKSINDRSEIGYFAPVNGDKRLVDDMHILTKIMKKRNPDIPYFLFGHSMGSFCARVYAAHFGEELNGLILCGTGEIPDISSALLGVFDKICVSYGEKTRVDAIGDTLNRAASLIVGEKDSPLAWLSVDGNNRLQYSNDDLCGFTYTLRGYRDLFAVMCEGCESAWAYKLPNLLPILIISGANDPIGTKGRGVLTVADNLVDAGIEPQVILYPGLRHEILNEEDNDRVYKDILDFIHNCYKVK